MFIKTILMISIEPKVTEWEEKERCSLLVISSPVNDRLITICIFKCHKLSRNIFYKKSIKCKFLF